MLKKKERLARNALDIPVAGIFAKIVSLRAQLGREIAKLLHPLAHHNNTTANNIQHLPEQQLSTILGVVPSVCTCRSEITSNKECTFFKYDEGVNALFRQ